MSFTTIINGEGDAMRHLEKKTTKAPAKTSSRRSSKKTDEAQLVLANGGMGEAARLGLSLVGAGLTAMTFGVLEGLARKGKVKWWRELSPHKRGLALMAFVIVSGLVARSRRKGGHIKSAQALESAALAAWTLAVACFIESGVAGDEAGKLGELYRREVGDLGVDELSALDDEIDGDIQSAAKRLRAMAEEEHTVRQEALDDRREEEEDDLGALAYEGEPLYDDEDDDIIY